ncbi:MULTISPECIES: DUF445 domain-containing protein [Desulfurella]|jgi:uncharacterized membrane-anchored protein YjiN (DUF445 family)|uniref:DUF445 domain-containing protein n=1 Tax=Desulfurella TaxID=33001 RepID=UPI000CB36ED7|nr:MULTISPECIES: DUF445 domain-containing protein [Desulfurella]PMP65515.1 MAG: hypothetical protein C0192_05125 [Desulfurella multipotens]PMP90428.1 MAG: hypothetical protein C0173_04465 [Desulfurella sp.]HEX13852.1 DUF445 domain-containing protein [Desulfurella acetivorans]
MNDKKKLANIFLLSSIAVFLICHIFATQNLVIYILQKVSEAAVVGGFADWFAVSALFRHPLGLKIPHTNIIENNRQKLIDSISKTVSDTWLSKTYLTVQINNINPTDIILNLSKKQRHINSLKNFIRKYILKILAFTYTKQFDSVLQKYVDTYIYKLNLYDFFQKNAKNFFESNLYQELYNSISTKIKHYITNINNKTICELIIKEIDTNVETKLSQTLKNIVDKKLDSIIENLCDFLELLIEYNADTISNYIENFIESYKNKTISKDIIITLLEGFNIIDKKALSQDLIEQLKSLILEIKQNKTNKIRLSIKNYATNQIYENQTKIHSYIIEFLYSILNQNIDKFKNYIVKYLDNENASRKIAKWINWFIDSDILSEFYKQNEFNIKMLISIKIQKSIKNAIIQNKSLITNKINFDKNFNYIYNYLINQLLQHKNEFNNFVKKKLIYIMKQNHYLIGKTVKQYLNNLQHEQLINQIESKVGNDLQYIRINGSIVGSIIGFVIAIASLIIKKI